MNTDVINRWMSRFIGQIGQRIYQRWQPTAVINLSFVICHLSFAATPVDPVSQLHSEVDQLLAIAYSGQSSEALADRTRPLLEKDFSFELVTRQAIGPGWRQFSPTEQQKTTDLLAGW
jgi:ABC-type transporter MlaC component